MTCGTRAYETPWGHFFVNRGFRGWGARAAMGPLGGRRRFFESGEVRLAVLSLLAEGPKHGYEIIKQLEQRSGGLYRASAGTVYPTLQLLEDEGLVQAESQEGKKFYAITEDGRRELANESDTVADIWGRAERWQEWSPWMGPHAYAIAGPIAHVVKAALKALHAAGDSPEKQDKVRSILENARKELEEALRAGRPSRKE